MRYSADLAERATAWLALSTEQKRGGDGSGLVELAHLWAAIQNVPVPACIRQCQYSERVHDVNAYLREYHRFTSTSSAMSDTPQTTYQLKPEYAGQTLTSDDWTKAVTAANLTDEDAEHFIAKGFDHVFQRIGAALVGAGEKVEGIGDGLADDSTDVVSDKPLVPEADLTAEQNAHEQTREALASTKRYYEGIEADLTTTKAQLAGQKAAYEKLESQYNLTEENRQQQVTALSAEQTAHTATKAQLAEVQQQLVDAQTALAAATAKGSKKAATPAPTTADTDSTQSDGTATGSN